MRFARRAVAVAMVALVAAVAHAQSSTLVFLVRHAEKGTQPANDPPLTAAGEARARALVEVLANAHIEAIISTPFARTLGTAKPLAEKLGIKIDSVAIGGAVPAHAQAVAAAVRKYPGKAVLVVGHSNTVTAIAAALGAPALPDLCDGDYDQIFVLELSATGPARFMRTRYGAPASDAQCAAMK